METRKISLTAAHLKWIAIITMFINHLCYGLYYNAGIDNYFLSDAHWYITRVAFVIFAFQIAEGMYYTRNRTKYILFLFIFGLISEVPFDLCFYQTPLEFSDQNVFFTLGFSALTIAIIDKLHKQPIYSILVTLAMMVICTLLKTNYMFIGVPVVVAFYYLRDNKKKQLLLSALVFTVFVILYFMYTYTQSMSFSDMLNYPRYWKVNAQELHGLLAWPLLALYNGQKGKNINKWFFYAFYPCHVLLIYLFVLVLNG